MFEVPASESIIALALAEDLSVSPDRFMPGAHPVATLLERDVTSSSVLSPGARFSGVIVAREEAVIAGLPLVASVFEAVSAAAGLSQPIEVFPLVAEGSRVEAGTAVMEVSGPALPILAGERTALDFLMLLSGIATETSRWAELAVDGLAICDTRKTSPGLRLLSKYAVAVGGGTNHRVGLSDMVLIKDNHIRAAGGITIAISRARAAHPELLIEVEADDLRQAREAVAAGADLVLLDNFDDAALAEAVYALRATAEARGRGVLIEASGGITRDRLSGIAASGVDRVSTSALTLGAQAIDFGFDERGAGRP